MDFIALLDDSTCSNGNTCKVLHKCSLIPSLKQV